jgi:hypothetical protein
MHYSQNNKKYCYIDPGNTAYIRDQIAATPQPTSKLDGAVENHS